MVNFDDIFPDLNQDEDGWTIFTPSADTRIMYVSNDGNDSTADYYGDDGLTRPADPFNPGSVQAFATFSAAFAHTRGGYPDWVLLRRGDEFSANMSPQSGRSPTEFSLIGSYGASGAMPIVSPAEAGTAVTFGRNRRYVALMGIDFYASGRDPSSSDYPGVGGSGFSAVTTHDEPIHHIYIEGCKFRFFSFNGLQIAGGDLHDIVIRRTAILNTYPGSAGHSQGLFVSGQNGYAYRILLEENIFDHNGWYSQAPGTPGTATLFNHNTYFEGTHYVTYKGNIFSRASSIGNKFAANLGAASSTNISITDNLYVDGEIGISIGGNTLGPDRYQNIEIEGNVFTEINLSRPTNRNLRWGIELIDWDGGSVKDNFFVHFNGPAVDSNVYAIKIPRDMKNVDIEGNVIYNLNPNGVSSLGDMLVVQFLSGGLKTNISVMGNILHEPINSLRLIDFTSSNDIGGFTFSDNQYYSANYNSAFRVSSSSMGMGDWVELSGETGAIWQASEPVPSVEDYMATLGETETIEAFFEKCREMGRYSWNTDYTAASVNEFIRGEYIPEPPLLTYRRPRYVYGNP